MASNLHQSNDKTMEPLFSPEQSMSWYALLLSKGLFVFGVLVYVMVQGAFLYGPLWTRDLPPEPDDSLAYLTKTVEMDECFFQDCQALKDLRGQMTFQTTDPAIRQQRSQIVGRIFQVYHPLFSAMILAIAWTFSTDVITAYKVLWQLSPVLFGLGFAYWVSVLWGSSAAGLALFMLAFSIFPDTGLHYFVPGNAALGVALFAWARILSRKGDAPLIIILGTLALVLLHPMGRIYSIMGAVMAATVFGIPRKRSTWAGIVGCLVIVALAFLISATVESPMLAFRPEPYGSGQGYLSSLGDSITAIGVQFQRTEPALLRSSLVFFGAALCGFLTVPWGRCVVILRVFTILFAFLVASLFYILPQHPADLFLRMLAPMVALLFGGVGAVTWFTLCQSYVLVSQPRPVPKDAPALKPSLHWPLVAFTVLAAFVIQIVLTGIEGWIVLTEHMKAREPLELSKSQPERLLSESRPDDRVLYDSMIVMPFYFVNGAMTRGAVFYPAIRGTPVEREWLDSQDLRYAALYNPMVVTQRVQGFEEEAWWQTKPSLRYSALDLQKPNRTLSINGKIPMNRLMWVQVESQDGEPLQSPEIFVDDATFDTCVEVVPLYSPGSLSENETATTAVKAGWKGWIRIRFPDLASLKGVRILSPNGKGSYSIGGLRFGNCQLQWPWKSKANMTVQPRTGDISPIKVSFDPRRLLPPPLSSKKLSVLDDGGSSVLIRMDPP